MLISKDKCSKLKRTVSFYAFYAKTSKTTFNNDQPRSGKEKDLWLETKLQNFQKTYKFPPNFSKCYQISQNFTKFHQISKYFSKAHQSSEIVHKYSKDMTNMLKLNQICKLNEDTMASYESQLRKEEKNLRYF